MSNFYIENNIKHEKDIRRKNLIGSLDYSLNVGKSKIFDKLNNSKSGPPVLITSETLTEVKSTIEFE